MKLLKYFLFGAFFGFILVKGEVISWFRIQEMFLFKAFHMYGVIGSAIVTGIISVALIRKFNIKSMNGEAINLAPKPFTLGNIFGGIIFGLGWAMTGACPAPLYALLGGGFTVMIVAILAAIAGTYVYGLLKDKLPH